MKITKIEIRKVFASNTEKNEIHVTSDGHKFFDRSHAVNHGKTLPDAAVETVTREDAMKDESNAERLESVRTRIEQLETILEQYKPEWEALAAEEAELEEKIAEEEAAAEAEAKRIADEAAAEEKRLADEAAAEAAKNSSQGSESNSSENTGNESAEGTGDPSGKSKNKNGKK